MSFKKILRVPEGKKVHLSDYDPDDTHGFENGNGIEEKLKKATSHLDNCQRLLWADRRHALLIVLQSMDGGGKDGTIRHVMAGVNPQGCRVTSFKVPSQTELGHDFLWRCYQAVPAKGEIGIFNRSHYEDVLVVRVRDIVPEEVWSERYDQINSFERILDRNGVTILKFFLHISKDEQERRLRERLTDPAKQWKLSRDDFEERKHWSEYMEAYEDALTQCNTDYGPWFIIPSNKKWFRNLAVSNIIVETLESMDLRFPPPNFDLSEIVL